MPTDGSSVGEKINQPLCDWVFKMIRLFLAKRAGDLFKRVGEKNRGEK